MYKIIFSMLLAISFGASAIDDSGYVRLVKQVRVKYQKEFPQANYRVMDPPTFPYQCTEIKETTGVMIPVMEIYPSTWSCYVQIIDTMPVRVRIAVQSWMPSKDSLPKILWSRMHSYQLNSSGNWFEYQSPVYVTEIFDTMMTMPSSRKKSYTYPKYTCSK